MDIQRVLVVGAHTDDAEFGAGGTIARFVDEGREVYYIVFSGCESSVPQGLPKDTLRRECLNATKIIGILPEKISLLDYDVRTFPEHRQEILENLIKFKQKYKPDLVLAPSSYDVHQDHNTIYWEVLRIFKNEASIWGYEHPFNNLTFTADIFVRLNQEHVERKIRALKEFKSQSYRRVFGESYLRSLAYARGARLDVPYAEAFELSRLLF